MNCFPVNENYALNYIRLINNVNCEDFKTRLVRLNSPNWMSVVIDGYNINQFYIVANGGMGNTISTPIERLCYSYAQRR
mgnify:CR=1 FL=1